MHSEIEKLLELQQLDREIGRLQAEIAALPRRVAEIEAKLARVNLEVENGRKAIKEIEASRRRFEVEIQAQQQKISKYREQMLGVKTNQEYKALGNEITFAEQQIRGIEDKVLEGMLAVEQREKELKTAETELKKQQAEVEKEKAQARTRTEQDEQRLSELTPQRDDVRSRIDPDLALLYDRLMKLRGSAMAEARDRRCQACYVQLRAQVFMDIIASQSVLTCESCGRILFFVAPDARPGPAGEQNATASDDAAAAIEASPEVSV